MKRVLVFVLLLSVLFFLGAAESAEMKEARHFDLSTSFVATSFGVSFDQGMSEWGINVKTSFPNTYFLFYSDVTEYDEEGNSVPNSLKQVGRNLLSSLNNGFGIEGLYHYDMLPSRRHDLDLGVGLVVGTFGWGFDLDSRVFGTYVESGLRYTYHFRNGNGLFIGMEMPLFIVCCGTDSNQFWVDALPLVADSEFAALLTMYIGTSLGYRMVL